MNILTRGSVLAAAMIMVLLGIPLVLMDVFSADDRKEQALIVAYIAQGLADAGGIKAMVSQYYQESGELPNDAEDLGMGRESDRDMLHKAGLAIGANGLITVHVRHPEGGTAGTLLLQPSRNESYRLDWRCFTGDFRRIQRFVPQCEYLGPDAQNLVR